MAAATTTASRYELHCEIGKGGTATVHLGLMRGAAGFARTVAIKQLHAQYAADIDFLSMLMDEARLAGRIRHPNVISPFDVVVDGGELLLVMDYVAGESMARLLGIARRSKTEVPARVACAIVASVLHGLHAAHEAKGDNGASLRIVHRDVSPQNVIVGADGVARVLDFGIALAKGRISSSRKGTLKGKIAYMAPEQVRGQAIDRRVDVYGAGVVLWEALSSRRLFEGRTDVQVLNKVLDGCGTSPRAFSPMLDSRLEAIVMRALAMDPDARFPTARDMARAIEDVGVAGTAEVGDWVESLAGPLLAQRAEQVAEIESRTSVIIPISARVASTTATATASIPTIVDARQSGVVRMFERPARGGVLLGVLVTSAAVAAALAFWFAR